MSPRRASNSHLESQAEDLLTTLVKEAGGLCFKFVPVTAGLPDRIVILPGNRVFFVELKQATTTLDPLQRVMHDKFAERGVHVFTLHGKDEVRAWVAEMTNNPIV